MLHASFLLSNSKAFRNALKRYLKAGQLRQVTGCTRCPY